MNKQPLTRDNCPNTRRIRFWSKGEIAESAHDRVKSVSYTHLTLPTTPYV